MKKTSLFLSLILVLTLAASPLAAASESATEREVIKDETVYANLSADGSVEQLQVVSRIDTPLPGRYTDYGQYTGVINLSGGEKPQISADEITWQLPGATAGFYYQGQLAEGELPFTLHIDYRLDGEAVSPEAIVGKSGSISISLEVKPNPKAAAYFRKNYVSQIQIPLDLDAARAISAPGAATVIVGKEATIAYTILPQAEAAYTLEFDTDKFELGAITITSSPFDPESIIDIDTKEIVDGLGEMNRGMEEMIAGTSKLKGGLSALDSSVGEIAAGAAQLAEGPTALAAGIKEYSAGASLIYEQAQRLDAGSSSLSSQGANLRSGYDALATGINGALNQMFAELAPLLESLPPEQQQALAARQAEMAAELEAQLGQFGSGLRSYTSGVSQAAQGVGELTQGLGQYASQGQNLAAGADELAAGANAMAAGLAELKANTGKLPREVQKLIAGQKEFKKGLDESAGLLDILAFSNNDLPAVSFVSEKITPRSVQFIARTPAFKVQEPERPVAVPEKTSFFSRLLRLFKKGK